MWFGEGLSATTDWLSAATADTPDLLEGVGWHWKGGEDQ